MQREEESRSVLAQVSRDSNLMLSGRNPGMLGGQTENRESVVRRQKQRPGIVRTSGL